MVTHACREHPQTSSSVLERPRTIGTRRVFVLILLVMAVWPWDLFCYHARADIARTLLDNLLMPFSELKFRHFIYADFLTGMQQAWKDFLYMWCFYTTREFLLPRNGGTCTNYFNVAVLFLGTLPFQWRLVQCIVKHINMPNAYNLLNIIKWTLSLNTLALAFLDNQFPDSGFHTSFVVSVIVTSLLSIFMDVTFDWGLFRPSSKRFPLREKMLFPPWTYYAAVVINAPLRVTWTISFTPTVFGFTNREYLLFGWALMEVFRRSLWALFRLEHEHMVNTEGTPARARRACHVWRKGGGEEGWWSNRCEGESQRERREGEEQEGYLSREGMQGGRRRGTLFIGAWIFLIN
jgi:hypothetical protein